MEREDDVEEEDSVEACRRAAWEGSRGAWRVVFEGWRAIRAPLDRRHADAMMEEGRPMLSGAQWLDVDVLRRDEVGGRSSGFD